MSRGGRPREGGVGRRTCLGCRGVFDKHLLVRLVLAPAGVEKDERQALRGRGAYVCRKEPCAARAAGRLAKALRAPHLALGRHDLWAIVSAGSS